MKVVIHGAGSIGCFIGGLLLRAGRDVTFLARPRIAEDLATYGLRLTDFTSLDVQIPASAVAVQTSPTCLRDAGLVIVTVKSGDTATAAQEIATHALPHAPVLSFQNGVDNLPALHTALRHRPILGGMVAFNVAHQGNGHFHRGTSGRVVIEAGRNDILSLLTVNGLDVMPSANIAAVQWGKLIINLNNALNALSGLPLRRQFENRSWRVLLADQMAEALAILRVANIKPQSITKVPLSFLPTILKLPNGLFRIIAKPLVQIDPEARSSMSDDLKLGRPTEVDYIQGAILRLAQRHAQKAPLTQRIIELVRNAEAAGLGPPGLLSKPSRKC